MKKIDTARKGLQSLIDTSIKSTSTFAVYKDRRSSFVRYKFCLNRVPWERQSKNQQAEIKRAINVIQAVYNVPVEISRAFRGTREECVTLLVKFPLVGNPEMVSLNKALTGCL